MLWVMTVSFVPWGDHWLYRAGVGQAKIKVIDDREVIAMGGAQSVGAGRARGRLGWRRIGVSASMVVALAASGCVPTPPSVPAPELPAGVGVGVGPRYGRDIGGR